MYERAAPINRSSSGTVALDAIPVTKVDMGLQDAGDTNGDNVVSIQDFNILRASFGKREGETGYDSRADLNGDTVVNATDFSLLARNYGHGGS